MTSQRIKRLKNVLKENRVRVRLWVLVLVGVEPGERTERRNGSGDGRVVWKVFGDVVDRVRLELI
jgi:hypothetical protein